MDNKISMRFTDHVPQVMDRMCSNGLLLASWKQPGQANAMTIGWGLIGSVWSRPIWQVMVRPSRFTCNLIEREKVFSVNVLPKNFNPALDICGSASGRTRDKLADAQLSVLPGPVTGAPIIQESIIHYECHVVHSNDFIPEAMVPDIREGNYPSGDYHRIFWGQIVDCRVDLSKLDRL